MLTMVVSTNAIEPHRPLSEQLPCIMHSVCSYTSVYRTVLFSGHCMPKDRVRHGLLAEPAKEQTQQQTAVALLATKQPGPGLKAACQHDATASARQLEERAAPAFMPPVNTPCILCYVGNLWVGPSTESLRALAVLLKESFSAAPQPGHSAH
jgi:hypothetical protein